MINKVKRIDLSHFTGTGKYHKFTMGNIVATDGVAFLISKGLHWLFSDMAITSQMKLKTRAYANFIVWRIELGKDNSSAIVTAWTDTPKDKDSTKLYQQKYRATNFYKITGRKSLEWYQVNDVFLLKSEY